MVETLTTHIPGDQPKWTWFNIMADLREQGHLDDIFMDPLSDTGKGCGGKYMGSRFYMTWVKDRFLLLSMKEHSQELVSGFSRVLEYEPFCKYTEENNLSTVEWDKLDPEGRFKELEIQGKRDLSRIEPSQPTTSA